MQVNPEDSPPDIYVMWLNPRMTDFENAWTLFRQFDQRNKNDEKYEFCIWFDEVRRLVVIDSSWMIANMCVKSQRDQICCCQ